MEYLQHLRRRDLSGNTVDKYRFQLAAFEAWLEQDLVVATAADIEAFIATRKVADRAKYEWISRLSCFYTWCRRAHGVPMLDPTEAITRPKLRKNLPRPISEEDLELAMTLAPDRRMYAWVVLGAYAGFRCCEIAWLDVDSVMWHEGLVNVFGKGRKERIVEMHPLVVDALKACGLPSHGRVFRKADGGPVSPRIVSNTGNAYLRSIGINATFHQLRHRFGTKTYEACRNIRVVQELLGHAHSSTTDVYTAFAREAARAAVLALPAPNAINEAA